MLCNLHLLMHSIISFSLHEFSLSVVSSQDISLSPVYYLDVRTVSWFILKYSIPSVVSF